MCKCKSWPPLSAFGRCSVRKKMVRALAEMDRYLLRACIRSLG